jgi:hypothetical protein
MVLVVGLQVLVAGLQVLAAGLQVLMAGLQVLVAGLQVLVAGLQVVAGCLASASATHARMRYLGLATAGAERRMAVLITFASQTPVAARALQPQRQHAPATRCSL